METCPDVLLDMHFHSGVPIYKQLRYLFCAASKKQKAERLANAELCAAARRNASELTLKPFREAPDPPKLMFLLAVIFKFLWDFTLFANLSSTHRFQLASRDTDAITMLRIIFSKPEASETICFEF